MGGPQDIDRNGSPFQSCAKFLVACCCCITPESLQKCSQSSMGVQIGCGMARQPRRPAGPAAVGVRKSRLAIGLPAGETAAPFQRNTVIRGYDPQRRQYNSLDLSAGGPTLTRFDLLTLALATENFSTEIGRGQFGVIYKGVLPDGSCKLVAVAVLRGRVSSILDPVTGSMPHTTRLADVRFLSEVVEIARLKRRNILPLIGFCLEHRYTLVFDYMASGGDLDDLLFDASDVDMDATPPSETDEERAMDWEARVRIANDMASGIAQIHEFWGTKRVCCHLSAKNVILDKERVAHVADFGLASMSSLLVPLLPRESESLAVADNRWKAYAPPEYLATAMDDCAQGRRGRLATKRVTRTTTTTTTTTAMAENFTEKHDVYSYGILLLELITGRRTGMISCSPDPIPWPHSPLHCHRQLVLSPRSRSPISSPRPPSPRRPMSLSVCHIRSSSQGGGLSPVSDSVAGHRSSSSAVGASGSSMNGIQFASLSWGYLPDTVSMYLHAGKLSHIVDPRLRGKFSRSQADRLIQIALACSSRRPPNRPHIKEVLMMLGGVMDVPLCHSSQHDDRQIDSINGLLSPSRLGEKDDVNRTKSRSLSSEAFKDSSLHEISGPEPQRSSSMAAFVFESKED